MAYSELRERKSKVEFGDVSTSKSFSKRAGPFPRVWRLYISTDALTLSHTMDYSLMHRHSQCTTAGDKKTSSSPENKKITLDDFRSAVCLIGDSSDGNAILLCDGQGGCYRAFPMKYIQPELKAERIANEAEDWFCSSNIPI